MSIYSVKGKGWRYDFTLSGQRYTEAWFTTKKQAKEAEARKRQEILRPQPIPESETTPTDITFLDLVNFRLDYIKAYKSAKYYQDHIYSAKKLVAAWGKLNCSNITSLMIQNYLIKRSKSGIVAANKELRYLRAIFNYGIKQNLITLNPTKGLEFIPVEKRVKYIPSKEDVAKVLLAADPNTQDYLVAIINTMARVGEINRLTWNDVDFENKHVVLYTRKKKGGHLTPRKIPMTNTLYNLLLKRFNNRDKTKPWVFWQRYWSQKEGKFLEGPYQDRKFIMKSLCKKTGVKYFRFHALRHHGASVLERANVPIGSIQRLLGHENRTTTEIYLHSIGESEREAMIVFEKASQISLPAEILTQTLTQEKVRG